MRKKAQSGMNAAMLVAILAALIVIYIIFLPSDERLDLIDNETEFGDNGDDNGKEILVLEESQIIMEHISDKEVEHDLPSINLYTSTESDVIKEESSVYVKNGLFDTQGKEIEFRIDDPSNTKNVLISFYAKKSKGRLIMTLNNYEIYNNKVEKVNINPIKVSKDLIAERNILSIEVSGVGAAFWSTNEYLLENFKVTGDVTDVSTRESELKFIIPQSEAKNIEKAELRFVPECQAGNVGVLDILINNNVIYSSVPDCGTPRPLEFSPVNIITGENRLVFRSDRGRYLIDQIRITTELEEAPSYTYFFDIEEEDMEDIEKEDKKANLTFLFVDDIEDKEAEIIINGGKIYMTRHDEFEWSADISRHVREGDNSLKVIPEENLEIRSFQIEIQEID